MFELLLCSSLTILPDFLFRRYVQGKRLGHEITKVQNVIAAGQVRPTDQLLEVQQMARPGTISVILEPLYPGQLDFLPQGGSCIIDPLSIMEG